jgi:hypothetical protein
MRDIGSYVSVVCVVLLLWIVIAYCWRTQCALYAVQDELYELRVAQSIPTIEREVVEEPVLGATQSSAEPEAPFPFLKPQVDDLPWSAFLPGDNVFDTGSRLRSSKGAEIATFHNRDSCEFVMLIVHRFQRLTPHIRHMEKNARADFEAAQACARHSKTIRAGCPGCDDSLRLERAKMNLDIAQAMLGLVKGPEA